MTINSGVLGGIDIDMAMDIGTPSGYSMSIQGEFTPPEGYEPLAPPIFIIVADAKNPDEIFNNPVNAIKEFQKVAPGQSNFNIDLSNTDLVPGDEVMVLALWDIDYKGGFPGPTPGDFVGFYFNTAEFKFNLVLANGINPVYPSGDVLFNVDREIFDFNSSVNGTIQDNESGDLFLIAYTGDMGSLDISSIDINNIVGYKKIDKPYGHYNYTLNIMPYGRDVPINDVMIIAYLDRNGNGIPDAGDRLGFYRNSADHMPETIDIYNGAIDNINIEITKRVYAFDTSISFKLNPDGRPSDMVPGDNLIAVAVHKDGVSGTSIDADYVIGMKNLTYISSSSYVYNFEMYNFIDESLGILYSGDEIDINVIVVFDRNGNGLPSTDEDIAAYWRQIFIYLPKIWKLEIDSLNVLSDPDNVRFINQRI